MRRYEITFNSVNAEGSPKPISALVIEPDRHTASTGVMLCTHGWGCNRYYDVDKIEWSCERFDLVCVSVEYRDCGFEFNPATGAGYCRPYDTSFYQVFDVLNGLRTVLDIHPKINRRRLFHFARSQGGHIALISSMFAPHTFAALVVPHGRLFAQRSEFGGEGLGVDVMRHDGIAGAVVDEQRAVDPVGVFEHVADGELSG